MSYRKKHATVREVPSGKITEVYLTPRHMTLLKKHKPAWLRVKGEWVIINPFIQPIKSKVEVQIEKLEAKLILLKQEHAGQPKQKSRKGWARRSPEEVAIHMKKMREARSRKRHNRVLQHS
jgi:hypothetical protein